MFLLSLILDSQCTIIIRPDPSLLSASSFHSLPKCCYSLPWAGLDLHSFTFLGDQRMLSRCHSFIPTSSSDPQSFCRYTYDLHSNSHTLKTRRSQSFDVRKTKAPPFPRPAQASSLVTQFTLQHELRRRGAVAQSISTSPTYSLYYRYNDATF